MVCSRAIKRTCLNPRFSLKVQMFLSFGTTAVIAISAFVMIGLSTTLNSGQSVRNEASNVLEEAIRYSLGRSAQYVAETMAKKFDNIGGAGSIIAEATRDRIVGYKSMDGWKTDVYVPFEDTITGLNIYPINADPLPLEWNLTGNINQNNFPQHMPYRTMDWYPDSAQLSSHGAYYMQGMCDPNQRNSSHPTYYPDCTEENNNILEGGVVQPTDTNYYLAEKGKDLVWVLKPIYESHLDIKTVGVFFANDGAGSTVRYPASSYDGTASYTSIGCDWMNVTHPITNRSVADQEQIDRCHKDGDRQTMREYNPLERGWCRDQVMRDIAVNNGEQSRELVNLISTGPYLDAFNVENVWVMTFGQGVFDMLTHEFIACTLVDVSVVILHDILLNTTVDDAQQTLESALIRWDEDGSVVVATEWDPKYEDSATTVTDPKLGLGLDAESWEQMRNLVDYNSVWDPVETMELYQKTIFVSGGKLVMSHPVPSIPATYDPHYEPVYFIVLSMEAKEAYDVLEDMEVLIRDDVRASGKDIIIVALVSFGVILLSIAFISFTLTKPLRWMQKVAGKIVDNAGGHDLSMGLPDEEDAADAKPYCSPRTEITLLLSEFVKMINEFSGDGAAEVAGASINEVKNKFEWKKMYGDLYAWGDDEEEEMDAFDPYNSDGFPKQLAIPSSKTGEPFDDEMTQETQRSEPSIFDIISSSIPAEYQPAVEKTKTLLRSVKEYAAMVGTKSGLLVEPPPEEVDGPPFVHRGQNIQKARDELKDYFEGVEAADQSYLFWWTTFFIGTPIVIAAALISVTVARDTGRNIPIWLSDVKNRTIDIELSALITATRSRSAFGEEVMHRFARDLHIYTRVAGWLLLSGLSRADSLTFQVSGSNECKYYGAERKRLYNETCPWLEDDTVTPCLCEWDDPWGYACTSLNATITETMGNPFNTSSNTTYYREHPRYWQHRWFEGSSSDADVLGNRFSTSYPQVDNWPNTTNWWNDTSTMPGAEKASNAAGYETTYDRVRVLSALSVADFPLYNYFAGKDEQRMLGSYFGVESDGMFTGYSGCESYAGLPFFQSTEGNKAAEVNPTMCPLGKYGFDCRCRGWYPDGYAAGGFTHITAPYGFASSDVVGMSAAAAVIHPQTQEHIGEMLIDFSPSTFINAVNNKNTAIGQGGSSGFPIIITPAPDISGADTVIGPGFEEGTDTAPISYVVLRHDPANSTNRLQFEEQVVERMRSGESYYGTFTRSLENGDQQELYMTYAPVMLRSLRSLDPSDFLAGVETRYAQVYALGFGISVVDLAIAFEAVEAKVNHDINRVAFISLAAIIGALFMVMYMTYTMSLYIAQPILCLVGIVQSISNKTLADELPDLEGGSCEIHDVWDSLEKLCKIVRFSNAAYFKGDRTKSYKVLEEALDLFVKMGNQKALGVANNNLGTMVLQEQMERSSTTARSEEVFQAGIKYFDEAIRIGTFEYQNADWDDYRGEFVKQLANRYFNRGMFYIVNRNKPFAGPEIEDQGVRDLDRAKSLDQEAYLYTRERGQTVQQARNEFFCLLRRARGMLTLIKDADFNDVWGIQDLVDQAHDMIHNPAFSDSSMFENVNLIARRQQVEDLRIQFAMAKGNTEEAARLAMKLLVEDEYVIDTVMLNCVTTLNTHYDLHGDPNQVPNLAEGLKRETRRGQVDSLRQAKNVIFCLDYSGSMAGERMQSCAPRINRCNRANMNLRWMYEEHCLDKDYVGFCRFNHAVDDKIYFDLERKGGKQDEHDAILAQALDAEGGTRLYAALNKCVTMSLESGNSFDTWIIALTDGESAWDFPAKQVVSRIEKYNKGEGPSIHVIVIGFDVTPEVADSVALITQITDKSLYIDAKGGLDKMDDAFEQVASVITGTAITMETF